MFNLKINICAATVFLLAFVQFTHQTDLFEGSVCTLHTGETGICKNADNCKWLALNLHKRKMKFSDIRRCTFAERNQEIVCCGDEHPNPVPEKPVTPCDLGYLFDSYKCDNTQSVEPTPSTVPVTVVSNENKFSGSRIVSACTKYAALATPYFPSSIINGRPAGLSEFPHVVALGYRNSDNEFDFDCGGTLIADNWVVTAAHCIKDSRKPIIVRMGKVTLHNDDDGVEAIDRNITRYVRHPQYSLSRKKNDIALVQFDGAVEFTDIVRPACIRTEPEDLPETRELFIAGWGSIEADRTNRSEILLKANVTNVPLERCNKTLLTFNRLSNLPSLRGLSLTQMCAINPNDNSDACQGDSGGPIFLNDNFSGVSTIVGIVSSVLVADQNYQAYTQGLHHLWIG